MDIDNPTEEENKDQSIETVNNGIVVESIEDDMKNLGIETDEQESKDVSETDEKSGKEAEKEDATTEKKPKKSRAQKKIERQAREIKELKAQAQQESSREDQHEQEDDEPKVEDFEDYDDYLDALEEKSAKVPEKKEAPVEKKAQPDSRIQDMLEDGEEDYENFEELLSAPDLALTQGLLNTVLESEAPADVAYYLATNKDETKELAKLSPRQQEKAILKLEIKLENGEQKKEPKQSNAPEPINPLNGGSSQAKTLDDGDLSYEDHEKLLNSKKNSSVGGFL